ncbi:MAG: Hsp20/alpha crystallin family protein [Methanomicrobiales archaeon]|nr:Hsp20/alpha crystallin family protein [Methanomicrobiales archaeon]
MEEKTVFPVIYSMPDEHHENLRIEIELPGVAKENIRLNMHEDSLSIRATKTGTVYVGTAAICNPVEPAKAKARYENGLLVIDVPYREMGRIGREIAIE